MFTDDMPGDWPDPFFLYGTAWKEEETARLTGLALEQGFRGIDTANQRKHYVESAVGEAVAEAIRLTLVKREQVFLQTKFTFVRGQDDRLPYDPEAPIGEQVRQSFHSSLGHLGTDYLDSYVLHGPSRRQGLGADDWAAWRSMEELFREGRIRALSISNVGLDQVQALAADAAVKPRYVQNRCYAARGWDRTMRDYCVAQGIRYQGFSLLTANRQVLGSDELARIASARNRTPAQIIFRFCLQAGMLPLTGTSSRGHMIEDLQALDFALDDTDMAAIADMGRT